MSEMARLVGARLDALEAGARAATPGPWIAKPPHDFDNWDEHLVYAAKPGPFDNGEITPGGGEHGDYGLTIANAAHVTAWDPTAVQRLVDGLRAVVDQAATWDALCAPDDWPEGDMSGAPLSDAGRWLLSKVAAALGVEGE